jgi:hypothetical protein
MGPPYGVPELIGLQPMVWMRHGGMSEGQSTSSALGVTQVCMKCVSMGLRPVWIEIDRDGNINSLVLHASSGRLTE